MTDENGIELISNDVLLSDLYRDDLPDGVLLAEYPSSNSDQTRFRNIDRYIIHDPFPPPRPELLKCLGPHHLMYGWGNQLPVTSQAKPPDGLFSHWRRVLGERAIPQWYEFDCFNDEQQFIVLFPHQSLPPEQQSVDPDINYFLHSKQVISQMDCPQAKTFDSVEYPCIAKLSHGYAGLGNYILRDENDYALMNQELAERWPTCEVVFNSIIEDVVGDYGVQFYVNKDGSPIWLGFTEQAFDKNGKWCGGQYSQHQQIGLLEDVAPIVKSASFYLSQQGYFGVVGIDILENKNNEFFLVDVNPRLTGITPFLIASRILGSSPLFCEGVYKASCRYSGNLEQLIEKAEAFENAKVVVLSAFEDQSNGTTICHLSVNSHSQDNCTKIFDQLLSTRSVND